MTETAATNERVLDDDDMAALFGIELEAPPPAVEGQGAKSHPCEAVSPETVHF